MNASPARPISPPRVTLTLLGAALGLVVAWPGVSAAPDLLRGDDLTGALSGAVALALAAVSAWLLVAASAVVLAERTGAGARWARRIAPTWLAIALSTGALALAAPAQATPANLDGLPLPDRVAVAAAPTALPTAPAQAPAAAPASTPPVATPAAAPATVVVQSGDCLWDLARQHAPAGASDAEVAELTAQWHSANLSVIGADPDVVRAGQVLTVPVTP